MDAGPPEELTNLLSAWKGGDSTALEKLMPMVYGELRRVAEHHLRRERPGHTLQATALIHEAYVRLVERGQPDWENRVHFFGVASRVMRQVLVDWARRTNAQRRGGAAGKVTLDEAVAFSTDRRSDLLVLDEALTALSEFDERGCRAVEMKYFGGLSIEEIAKELGVSVATVGRDVRAAEAWLRTRLEQ